MEFVKNKLKKKRFFRQAARVRSTKKPGRTNRLGFQLSICAIFYFLCKKSGIFKVFSSTELLISTGFWIPATGLAPG